MDSRFAMSSWDERDDEHGAPSSVPEPLAGWPEPADCATVRPLLEAFHDGALSASSARAVSSHVSDCPACAARLRQFADLDQLVLAAPMPTPGPALRERVYRAIAAKETTEPTSARTRGRAPAPTADPPASTRRSSAFDAPPVPITRRSRGWLSAGALAAVALALVILFVSLGRVPTGPVHPGSTATTQAATPEASAIPTPVSHAVPGATLPTFSDWRAVYVDAFGTVHVASLNGRNDVQLSGFGNLSEYSGHAMSSNGTYFNGQGQHVGMSPDGHVLAFITGIKTGTLELLNVAPSTGAQATLTDVAITIGGGGFAWSPDGSRLAAGGVLGGVTGLYLIDARTGAATLVHGTQAGGPVGYDTSQQIFGWIDATHILVNVYASRPTNPTSVPASGPYALVSLDVTNGAVTPIDIPAGWTPAVIVPGSEPSALIVPGGCQSCPSPATGFALLDLVTGHVTQLPQIEQALGDTLFPAAANRASASPTFAAAPGITQNPRALLYLADLLADTATPIATGYEPLGWTPDGQTLLVLDWKDVSNASGGPAYLTLALTPASSPVSAVAVTSYLVAFLGFVRTA